MIKKLISKNITKDIKVKSYVALLFLILLTATSGLSGYLLAKNGTGSTVTKVQASDIEVKKTKTPQFQFFVMSFCPYGNQIEDVIKPVADLLEDKADIKPQYIFDKVQGNLDTYCKGRAPDPSMCQQFIDSQQFTGTISECQKIIADQISSCKDEKQYIKIDDTYYTALHGKVEANQQIREICAWNLADKKQTWWQFVDLVNKNCTSQNADTCWQTQAKQAGLDTDKITDCFNNQAKSLIEAEIALTDKFGVSASPTLLLEGTEFPPNDAYKQDGSGAVKINGTLVKQADFRTPEGLKQTICSVFSKKPSECKTVLGTSDEVDAPSAGGC